MKTQGTLVHKDPVCEMQVSPKSAVETVNYQGKVYYFCSALCRDAFEVEPRKYVHLRQMGGLTPKGKATDDQRGGSPP